jgi:hypothetical protein
MIESRSSRLGSDASQGVVPLTEGVRIARIVIKVIDDSLVETLGSDLALAVRMCLSTSVALSDPLAYASALEVMLGDEKSELALDRIGKRLHELEAHLKPTGRGSFSEAILALRSAYSLEILHNSK